jgi:hypothetical protein
MRVTKQQVRDLNDPPRNGRTRSSVVAPPAKATRCQHVYSEQAFDHVCDLCGHIRGERTGRGFR